MLSGEASQGCRVLIVDDHPAVREGLALRINQQPGMEVCCEASGIQEAKQQLKICTPDVAVIDISLGDGNGIDLIRWIKASGDPVRILVWSMHPDSLYAERALRAGALGYINKQNTTGQLVEAIQTVSQNNLYLSDEATRLMLLGNLGHPVKVSLVDKLSNRELQVFKLIGEGQTTPTIAEQLSISVNTVETHRQRIKSKLDLKSARQLTVRAARWLLEEA